MIRTWFRSLFHATTDGWKRFWFTPTDGATLGVIRIATGLLLFYSHLVWVFDSNAFFSDSGWLNEESVDAIQSGFAWSLHWSAADSPWLLAGLHVVALLSAMFLTLGLFSRIAAPVSFLLLVSTVNRVPQALYGFDQLLGLLTLYLSIHPGHGFLSLDAWRQRRAEQGLAGPSVSAGVATRMIQLHLCLIYLMAGLTKLQGEAWWSGVAFWGCIANLEYQTVDLTWLVDWPVLINLLTHITVAWEISYAALVWNRWARPLVIALAIPVHLGIALCFGMMTFGLAMLVANLAFVSPMLIRRMVHQSGTDHSDEAFFFEEPARPGARDLQSIRRQSQAVETIAR